MSDLRDKNIMEADDLIRREKEEALAGFDEQGFRLHLDRKILDLSAQSVRAVLVSKKTVVVFASVLILVFLTWAAFRIFLPDPSTRNYRVFKTVLAQAFEMHGENLGKSHFALGEERDAAESEFQWALKRVLFSILKEKGSTESETQVFRDVLWRAPAFSNTGETR